MTSNSPNPDPTEIFSNWLDATTSGSSTPETGIDADLESVQDAAHQFHGLVATGSHHALALRSRPTPWEDIMHTAPLPTPVVAIPPERERTYHAPGTAASRQRAWVSTALVAMMLLGMAGGVWWFGPGQGGPSDDTPLQLAALTPANGTLAAILPEPLTPDEAPWIAPVSPDECAAEPLGYEEFAAAKTSDPGPPRGSYEITGVPDPADAQAVVSVLRAWLACGDTNDILASRAYLTSEFIFYYSGFTADNATYQDELDRRRVEATRQWTIWARDSDLYPMSVVDGFDPPEDIVVIFRFSQGVLDGTETFVDEIRTPTTYFEPRFDPEDAVVLADGRIMIPTRYIYWADDPWLQEYGLSAEPNIWTSALVLKNVDGTWKIDESYISLCVGACDEVLAGAVATPGATPVTTPVG